MTVSLLELARQCSSLLLIDAKIDGVEPVDLLLEAKEVSVGTDVPSARRGLRKRTRDIREQRRQRRICARGELPQRNADESFHAPAPACARIDGPPSTSSSCSRFVFVDDTVAARRVGSAT